MRGVTNEFIFLQCFKEPSKSPTLHCRLFLLLFCICMLQEGTGQLTRFSFSTEKMGSPFNLIFYAHDKIQADSVANHCFVLVDTLNAHFSDYDSTSELSRLSASAGSGPRKISVVMMNILLFSKKAYTMSSGAFDITIGPLSRLWRKARKEKIFPSAQQVLKRKALVNFSVIKIDTGRREVDLPVKNTLLDLGGIAQGYVAQAVLDLLKTFGINQALVDASGDMAISNAPPGTKGWVIGVNVPEQTDNLLPQKLLLQNTAVSTSGDAYQYMEHAGKKYSHITNPQTGYGITSQRNVTVIVKDGTDADWLATACSIVSFELVKKLAVENNASVLVTVLKKGKVVYHSFGKFERYWKK